MLLSALRGQPLLVTVMLCAIPYLGLVGYSAASSTPPPLIAALFAVCAGVLPVVGLTVALARVIRDHTRFRIMALLQSYASLILVFAALYTLAHVGPGAPAIRGFLPLHGAETSPVVALHRIMGDSLYLSVITITTVGYGDFTPVTPLAKLLSALEGLAGIAFMGLALGYYFSVCTHCASAEEEGSP
ncbi:MAG: two pore domain potassium channel family protein [Myxococcales bacterium]|nr:two pore domain potassium channel family protein [Myxococcales bacterium]